MKTRKFQLGITDRQTIAMPQGAEILSVQVQHQALCLWALVDPGQPCQPRVFRIYGTGHSIDQEVGGYVGSVQMANGSLVWHVFEVTEGAS